MGDKSVIVIGGGIAGLTSTALLAHEGLPVTLLESHRQTGGCAGTYRRGPYVFDVGATQVAGLEAGGIHERLFRHLKMPALSADLLDPACVVDLADNSAPIHIWHDLSRWKVERQIQFPGSEPFWNLCRLLHSSNWSFAGRDPVLPARSLWDLGQFLKALRPLNVLSGLWCTLSIADLLRLTGCANDKRLKKFLDLQLKLYSQQPAERTSALYGATVLQMAQSPLGLWHLQGSMQELSDHLTKSLLRDGANLFVDHRVVSIDPGNRYKQWVVSVETSRGQSSNFYADDVIFTIPPQCLDKLIIDPSNVAKNYLQKLNNLPRPSGAVVFYGALNRTSLANNAITHLQIASKYFGSLFLSISRNGDGRAPEGEATIIASIFAETEFWSSLNVENYKLEKELILSKIIDELNQELGVEPHDWIHKELATPITFEKWTGRPEGIVGGLGQHPLRSGIFGLPSRTPISGLWLCGDSIHPGEGTAGVSQSALMACKQLMASRGLTLNIPI